MASTTAGGVLPELQREMDEFMATHGTVLNATVSQTSVRVEIATHNRTEAPLSRLRWMATTLSSSRLCETTQFVLSWLAGIEGVGPRRETAVVKSASWLVAYLVGEILETRLMTSPSETTHNGLAVNGATHEPRHDGESTVAATERMVEQVLDRCVAVFQEAFQSDAARAVESGGGFFAFKAVINQPKAPTPNDMLQESVAIAWRRVLALVSHCSLNPIRQRLQKQLLAPLLHGKPSANSNGKEYLLLKNLSDMRLGLDVTAFLWPSNIQQKVKDAAVLLKLLQPLTLKPHKTPTRLAAITAIASLLHREFDALKSTGLQRLYTSFHTVTEWTSSISELHAATLKVCGKREYAIAAWELRIALLSMAPNEIFNRYWKEDVHALLRVQYHHNKDGGGSGHQAMAVLECVGRCFAHMIKRHFLTDGRIPGELDCMEIINTTQAWCFFAFPKQRSLEKLVDQVLPVLVQISIGIASYNMLYAIQSHLRRLLLEADHLFDEKKLVGLVALDALCELCWGNVDVDLSRPLDRNVLLANRTTLGELVGQTLIEANTLFGGDLLIESTTAQAPGSAAGLRTPNLPISAATKLLRDDYRRAIAIRCYACALRSLKHLYVALELSDDQKILILVRSSIHNEPSVRDSASAALHHVIRGVSRQATVIFRGVTDYIFRLSNHLTTPRDFDAFLVLIELTTSLLRSITSPQTSDMPSIVVPWESRNAKLESLLQIESVAVYLLVFEDGRLLEAAVAALEVVAQSRAVAFTKCGDADAIETAATVERPSVIDVLHKAEWDLCALLFSFEPQPLVDSLALADLGFFRQLIAELAGNPRASFRWSSCLAVVFAQLAMWNPEVAVFMWSDVNDKVTKLEPAMPSLLESDPPGSSFDLARWRNLAILAATTACPHLMVQRVLREDDDQSERLGDDDNKNNSVQSVISSSTVQTLFKRLSRFLKSPSIEQKKAVILALGSTHVSSLPILTEVLQTYETEAFAPIVEPPPSSSRHGSQVNMSPAIGMAIPLHGVGNGIGPRRATKEHKARNSRAATQLQLQWALGRCYRLLLHTTHQRPLLSDDTTREAVLRLQAIALSVLDKTATALMNFQQTHHGRAAHETRDIPHHIVFMMQQDLCSSIRALAVLMKANQTSYVSIHERQSDSTRRIHLWESRHRSHLPSASVRQRATTLSDSPTSLLFELKLRDAWYALLLSWCHSFSSLANARLSANLSGSFFASESPARDHWLQRCDVLGERVGDTLVPWQWVDEGDATRALGIQEAAMASFQRFFVCQTAFATLPFIVHGPVFLPEPITQDSTVFRWLDECFAVEITPSSDGKREDDDVGTHHFQGLKLYCHQVLGAFLQSDFRTFVDVCVAKSFFSVSSGDKHNVAKHYFRAVCSVAKELKQLLQCVLPDASLTMDVKDASLQQRSSLRSANTSTHNLQVRVCHAILMHLGIDNDPHQRQRAADLINELFSQAIDLDSDHDSLPFRLNPTVSSAKRSNATFGAQVVNRMQVAGASFLVTKLASFAYPVSMSILKFLSCCEPVQQKKSLVVVLPWLAEVSLVIPQKTRLSHVDIRTSEPLRSPAAFDTDQLLSLMFRITTNLGSSCSDQLEQAWLTLAFAEPRGLEFNAPSDHQPRDSNLSKVLQFLFLQRTTSVRLATAKIVMWWLCRWQSAAHEVLREALALVESRRRESTAFHYANTETSTGTTIQPVDDVFVFVILMSDSCCHLATIPSYLYLHPALRETMMVQAMHFAFLALFALALDPKAFDVRRTIARASENNVDDHQHQSLYVDASSDCLVLLRNLLGQLYGPVELLAPIVDDLAAWSRSWEQEQAHASTDNKRGGDRTALTTIRDHKSIRQLEQLMASFASCLPPSLRNAWALECVKEITLALVPGSTLLQQTSSRCNNAQVLLCVRFGLLGYRVLAPSFHGDVFLTLLDLLHHALDEHGRDPTTAVAVISETLEALRSMVACMPPQKLVLYPQILWVCVALLNHGKNETLSFQSQIVELFVEILNMPHFATNQLLQDVLLSKKPPQWSDDQASVLRTLVWSLVRSPVASQRLALPAVASFLVLPSPVFHANSIEHLIIISMTLMPFIIAKAMHQEESQGSETPYTPEQDGENTDEESVSIVIGTSQHLTNIQFAWLAVGSESISDALSSIQPMLSHRDAAPEDDGSSENVRSLVDKFAVAFVSELVVLGGEEVAVLVTLCFEILVKILATEDIKKRHVQHIVIEKSKLASQDAVVTATLWLVESLMAQLGHRKLAWRPTSVLLGSLARLVRSPEQTQTWQAAVRIMSCVGPSHRVPSATTAVRIHSSLSISTTSTTPPDRPQPQSFDSPVRISGLQTREERMASGAVTPGKKDGAARKFMNFMGHRSSASGSNHSSPSHNQASHAHPIPTGRPSAVATRDTKKSSPTPDPSDERSASPLQSRRDL